MDDLLADGQLGERTRRLYPELGTALAYLLQAASCAWGCRGDDHVKENLLRRLGNFAIAAMRLARLGLYDEALGMVRSMAELANLIELFEQIGRLKMELEWLKKKVRGSRVNPGGPCRTARPSLRRRREARDRPSSPTRHRMPPVAMRVATAPWAARGS